MRAVAEFVMRGRSQAILVSVGAGILPLMQWLSISVVSLVVLRKGLAEGALVMAWAALPAGLFFFLSKNPSPLLALIGTAILAATLRLAVSWELTLVVCAVIGVMSGWIFELLAMDFIVMFAESYLEFLRKEQLGPIPDLETFKIQLVGYLALGQVWGMILFLVLARWWQSLLYNPGGFQTEFHALRLSPSLSTVLVAVLLIIIVVGGPEWHRYQSLSALPLIVAGLGFGHWYMKLKQPGVYWVPFFYIVFILFFQILYPLLAVLAFLDSWVNLRKKVNDSMTGV